MSSLSHQITTYIVQAASASIETLAQQWFDLDRELEGAADEGARDRLEDLQHAIDAIGYCRFREAWEQARDSGGVNQDAA